jgi:hypothetical protein
MLYLIYETNTRGICLCYPFMFILLCFRLHGQHRRTQVHRKKDDRRQPHAEEYQDVDMIGTRDLRGREQIEAYNNSLREGWYEGEKQLASILDF